MSYNIKQTLYMKTIMDLHYLHILIEITNLFVDAKA